MAPGELDPDLSARLEAVLPSDKLDALQDFNSEDLAAVSEALNNFERIGEIYLSLPNKHFTPVNLAPFGMDNPGEVFLPTDEPHGLIEATLRKG